MRFLSFFVLLIGALTATCAAAEPGLQFEDPRLAVWSERWQAGEHDAVVAALEADLVTASPHPLAVTGWIMVHKRQGRLAEALEAASPALRAVVQESTTAALLADADTPAQLLAAYPVERIAACADFFLLRLIRNAAADECRVDQEVAAIVRMVEVMPDSYYPVNAAEEIAGGADRQAVAKLQAALAASPAGEGALAAVIMEEIRLQAGLSGYERVRNANRLALVRAWLEAHPSDALGLIYLGNLEAAQHRLHDARHHFREAMVLFPFYWNDACEAAMLVQLYDDDTARESLAVWTGKTGAALDYRWATVLKNGNRPMPAREILAELIAADPTDAKAYALLARIEDGVSRPAFAAEHMEKALALEPANLDYIQGLMGYLRQIGRADDALALAEKTRAAGLIAGRGRLSRNFYYEHMGALTALDRPADRVAVAREAAAAYPASNWMQGHFGYSLKLAGDQDEALSVLRATITRWPNYRWSVQEYRTLLTEVKGADAVTTELAACREACPQAESLWRESAIHVGGVDRIQVYKEAMAANPGRYWALVLSIDARADYAHSFPTTLPANEERDYASLGDEAETVNLSLWMATQNFYRINGLVPPDTATLLALTERYRELGDLSWYHIFRSRIHLAAGDRKLAAEAITAAVTMNPDETDWVHEARQTHVDTLGLGYANFLLLRHMEQNPYDAKRTNTAVHYLNKWGGSKVVAMRWCEFLRDAQPDAFANGRGKTEYYAILAGFGDHRTAYEREYARVDSVSPSQRFIDWYESRRRQAMEQEWVDIQFDYTANTVSVTRADGSVFIRGFHPISGKYTRLQSGDAWVTAEYGEYGDSLLRMRTSTGREVALSYNDAGQIVEMTDSTGGHLRFTYNEIGKPGIIEVVGMGKIFTTYDENGETLETRAEGGDGTELAIAMSEAFGNLLTISRVFESEDMDELMPDDPQADALLDAAEAAIDGDDAVVAITSQIDLAEHYRANAARNPYYRANAASSYAEAWDIVMMLDATVPDAVLARLLEGWWGLERERFALGMDSESMAAWAERLGYLREQQVAQNSAALAAALKAVEATPIPIMEQARWMPKSDLQNPGFWRRWDISEILPVTLPTDTRLTAVLARRNGDTVVGTTRGICVMRRGWWEWYGYDETASRFSADTLPSALKASSDILCLAESADGATLWIGTANGLVELQQPDAAIPDDDDMDAEPAAAQAFRYDAAVRRHITRPSGLTSPRIEQLAVTDSGLVVRTPRGIAIIGETDQEPLFTGDESPRFLSPFVWHSARFTLDVAYLVEAVELDAEAHGKALATVAERVADDKPFGALLRPVLGEGAAEMTDAEIEDAIRWNFCDIDWMEERRVLVGTTAGVYWLANGEPQRLTDRVVEAAVCDSYMETVTVLMQGHLYTADWNGEDALAEFTAVTDQGNIQSSGTIHGIGLLPIPSGDDDSYGDEDEDGDTMAQNRLAVYTDQGMSIHSSNHFEHLTVRGDGRNSGVRAATSQGASWVLLGDAGIHVFDAAKVQHQDTNVTDLRTSARWKMTFVATGGWLYAVPHATGEVMDFSSVSASHLALDATERLITTDGTDIVRFGVGSTDYEYLFSARSSYGEVSRRVSSLIVATDGTIWVSAGASVFRWREGDDEATEYCYFTDADAFPSRTHYMTRVVETVAGEILALGSNEGHLNHNGKPLVGGVLKWTGEGWERVVSGMPEERFWLSYTPISETDVIAGTSGGFQVIRNGKLLAAEELHPSYRELKAANPRLFMGSRGVAIGDGVWLFGCARGVVAYRDGTWLDATRLNWLLPDQHLAAYGARHVNHVETDPAGRIYVGTATGLLIYDGRQDGTSFLFTQGQGDLAIAESERQKLMEQSEVLLGGLLADETQTGETVEQLRRILEQRRRDAAADRERGRLVSAPVFAGQPADDAETRAADVDLSRQLRILQRRDPGLYQLLELKPLDLMSLRRELPDGTMVLQLLPTRDTLYLHIMDNTSAVIREVDVSRADLDTRALRVARALRVDSRNLRGFKADAGEAPQVLTEAERQALLREDLAWLYQQIMRPADDWLSSHDRCLVVPPAGPLVYVPMGALIKSPDSAKPYAVQHYNMAVVTDLFLLQHGLRGEPSINTDTLVMGDPDGSLPGARGEAQAVAGMVGGDIPAQIGEDAKTSWLIDRSRDAAVIHLATHGKLDGARPERSTLLFADRSMSVCEVPLLKLRDVDLVVLSCCESGVGTTSLEYSTLARAFIGSGAKSTIATLWQVNDLHSQDLMQRFYTHYVESHDPVKSLTMAKRDMIASHPAELSPAAWSGYVIFGCPPAAD